MDIEPPISMTDTVADSDVAELRGRLHEFSSEQTGYRSGRSLACFLRNPDGELIAGIDGFTWGGYARIECVWVDETWRGRGLGRQLIEAAEREVVARGCQTIVVGAHGFQAPELYGQLGHELVGTTHDTPVGYRQFLYQKGFAPYAPPSERA